MNLYRLVMPQWSLSLPLIASFDLPASAAITARYDSEDCTEWVGTPTAADLWDTLRAILETYAIPFDWYTPETLVQHRPTADDPVRTFPLSPTGDPLISARFPDDAPVPNPHPQLFPRLPHDPHRNVALVTPHGVAHVGIAHPTENPDYPAIFLYLNGNPVVVLEHHADYHTWVARIYARDQEDPQAYLRLDTGEPLEP